MGTYCTYILGPFDRPGRDYLLGGWKKAKVRQEIVDFAVSQFSGINEACFNIEVENFKVQVELSLDCRGEVL